MKLYDSTLTSDFLQLISPTEYTLQLGGISPTRPTRNTVSKCGSLLIHWDAFPPFLSSLSTTAEPSHSAASQGVSEQHQALLALRRAPGSSSSSPLPSPGCQRQDTAVGGQVLHWGCRVSTALGAQPTLSPTQPSSGCTAHPEPSTCSTTAPASPQKQWLTS